MLHAHEDLIRIARYVNAIAKLDDSLQQTIQLMIDAGPWLSEIRYATAQLSERIRLVQLIQARLALDLR